MNLPRQNHFAAAVYDPSFRRPETSSYWQWQCGQFGRDWDDVAESVNQGWPARHEIENPGSKQYGCVSTPDSGFWIYRLYAAGKDRFGRDGRYFFVLVRVTSSEEALSPRVAGLFRYFETERGLPLRTEPLDQGWDVAAPDEILRAIVEEHGRGRSERHWGIDEGLQITVFEREQRPEPATPAASTIGPDDSQQTQHWLLGPVSLIDKLLRVDEIPAIYWRRHARSFALYAILVLLVFLAIYLWPKPAPIIVPPTITEPEPLEQPVVEGQPETYTQPKAGVTDAPPAEGPVSPTRQNSSPESGQASPGNAVPLPTEIPEIPPKTPAAPDAANDEAQRKQ